MTTPASALPARWHLPPLLWWSALLHAAGIWTNDLHQEIYVFDSGYWSKDANLWTEVQKADWADVILEDAFKKNLQKDVFGFFDSEELYKSLAIPWKVRSPSVRGTSVDVSHSVEL